MSNVDQPNVNTDDGFRAALEQAVATGHANDAGLGGQEPVTPSTPEGTTDEGAQTTQVDAETQALIDRFGGVEGLAKAFNEGQSLIGRQGNELGDIRQRLEAVEAARAAPATPAVFMSPDQIEEAIQTYGGQAVVEYLEQTNPALIQPAVEAWGEYEPFKAALFVVKKNQEYQESQVPDDAFPELEELLMERNLQLTAEEAAQKYSDWAELSDVIGDALDKSPEKIQQLVTSSDADDRMLGLEFVVYKARELRAAALATPEGQAAAQQAKVAAQVTTGSLVPVGGAGGNPNESEAVSSFKDSIRETPSTSIFDGLVTPEGRKMSFGS